MKCLVTQLDLDVNLPLERIGTFKIDFPEGCNGIFFAVGKTANDVSCLVEVEGDAYFGASASAESGDTSFEAVTWISTGGLSGKYLFSNGACTVFISNQGNVKRINIGNTSLSLDNIAFDNMKNLQMITIYAIGGEINLSKAESLSAIYGSNNLVFTCPMIHEHKTVGNGTIIFKTITDCTNFVKSLPTDFTSVVYNGGTPSGNTMQLKTKTNDIVDYANLDAQTKAQILAVLQCNRSSIYGNFIGTFKVLGHAYTYDGTNLYCDGSIVN